MNRGQPAADPSANLRVDAPAAGLETLAREEAEDGRKMRASLRAAVAFHVVLLLVNFPLVESDPHAREKDAAVFVLKQPRYAPPEVEREEIPARRVVTVPRPVHPGCRFDHDRSGPSPPPGLVPGDFGYTTLDAPPPIAPKGPIHVSGDVRPPEKISGPWPRYTEMARTPRVQGLVILQVIIDENGDVTSVKVLKGLPLGLTEAAREAVQQWKFSPATLDGEPVAVYYDVNVSFRLQ